jgi:hypothetical protein
MADVSFHPIQLVGDDLVAAAVKAGAGAKRDVNVSGKGLSGSGTPAGSRGQPIVLRRDPIGELLRCRIGGIPRTLPIIAAHSSGIK